MILTIVTYGDCVIFALWPTFASKKATLAVLACVCSSPETCNAYFRSP
jgi:hypothetical protein